jgi:hypothetical protein
MRLPASIHSRYNPRREAERYINSLNLSEDTEYFLLIEPGEGYLAEVLQNKFPYTKILILHAGKGWPSRPGLPVWEPDSNMGIQDFLEREIPDTEAGKLKIVEWRPAFSFYGEAYREVLAETVEFIKRIDANTKTIRGFGKRWFKNFFKNLLLPEQLVFYREISCPVLVTAPGPGLEASLESIKKIKKTGRVFTIAVSSSVLTLLCAGIVPDLVISTDGGGWALLHLYEALRFIQSPPYGLAASLSAALPSQCSACPQILIADGSRWQRHVLEKLGLPHISFPQRGTVSASALDLAFFLKKEKVYAAGIDLKNSGIKTHARPYSFERLIREQASRMKSEYSLAFERSHALERGGSHNIYASWFSRHSWPGKVLPLGRDSAFGSDEGDTNLQNLKKEAAASGPPETEYFTIKEAGEKRKEKAKAFLLDALRDKENGAEIQGELGSLLQLNSREEGEIYAAVETLIRTGENVRG